MSPLTLASGRSLLPLLRDRQLLTAICVWLFIGGLCVVFASAMAMGV